MDVDFKNFSCLYFFGLALSSLGMFYFIMDRVGYFYLIFELAYWGYLTKKSANNKLNLRPNINLNYL